MKKILLYTLMTVAAAGMTACEDFLTRDTYDQIWSYMPTDSSRR